MLATRTARAPLAAAAAVVTTVTALTALAPAASAGRLPHSAWGQFLSDINASQGLVPGRGVTIALLSTGVDTSVGNFAGEVTNGPDYVFAPQAPMEHMGGTLTAELILGVPGGFSGLIPGARILSLRTEPDQSEPGFQSWYDASGGEDLLQSDAKAISYAVSHGAAVIVTDAAFDSPDPDLLAAVNYALSKNVVIVAPEDGVPGQRGNYVYPAGLPGVIGVSAVTLPGGMPAYSANTIAANNSVLISAPGNTVTVSPDGWQGDGPEIAISVVAATAALIEEKYPHLPPPLVARALAMSARYAPAGGYSTDGGFGVVDPYDAVLDAASLGRPALTAPAGAAGTVAAAAHFGRSPGVFSAMPPADPPAWADWALIGVGAAALACAAALAVRRRHRPRPSVQRLPGLPEIDGLILIEPRSSPCQDKNIRC